METNATPPTYFYHFTEIDSFMQQIRSLVIPYRTPPLYDFPLYDELCEIAWNQPFMSKSQSKQLWTLTGDIPQLMSHYINDGHRTRVAQLVEKAYNLFSEIQLNHLPELTSSDAKALMEWIDEFAKDKPGNYHQEVYLLEQPMPYLMRAAYGEEQDHTYDDQVVICYQALKTIKQKPDDQLTPNDFLVEETAINELCYFFKNVRTHKTQDLPQSTRPPFFKRFFSKLLNLNKPNNF